MTTKYLVPIVSSLWLVLLQGCVRNRFVDHSQVLARVNGQPLTEENYEYYIRARDRIEPPSLDPKRARIIALNEMINTMVLAQDARRSGIGRDPAVHFAIQQQRDNILARALVRRYLKDHPVSSAELTAAYQKEYQDGGQVEYRARHILVHNQAEANQILRELRNGARFSVLARHLSLDTHSATQGGELGWFSRTQMLPSFVAGIAALKPGEISPKPIRTEFGWHVVQLEGIRMAPAPPFYDVRARLYRQLVQVHLNHLIARLHKQAHISRP